MAKAMKVPVLIFEHIQEPIILLEGLDRTLNNSPFEEKRILILIKELRKIKKIIEKTNIR
jgi:hypothetical protein